MILLIDKVQKEADRGGYIIEEKRGKKVKGNFYLVISRYFFKPENTKLITDGHVFILNYNKETYIPKSPETYEEYRNTIYPNKK